MQRIAGMDYLDKFEISGRANITIYNMDCMAYLRECQDKQFDLAIVDPPYNLQCFTKPRSPKDTRFKSIGNKLQWNNNKPDESYFQKLFNASANQIIWGANNFELPITEYFCVWDKEQTVDNFSSAEYAWVSLGLKMPAKVFRYSIHKNNRNKCKFHPTQKPVDLYKWLLDKYAKDGQLILDTHLGSGSIAIACWDLGFDLVACELDTDYFHAACERLSNHTKQGQLF